MKTEFFDRQTTSVTYRALFEMKPLVFRTVAFIMRANAIAMRLSHCVNHSNERRIFKLGNSIMATAKKVAPKAATKADKAAPAKSA